jgi:hypothetical protein
MSPLIRYLLNPQLVTVASAILPRLQATYAFYHITIIRDRPKSEITIEFCITVATHHTLFCHKCS